MSELGSRKKLFERPDMSTHHINNKKYYESLPQKRIAVGALLFYKSELLILRPAHTTDFLDNPVARNWVLPGGIVEAEESPEEALRREIKNQLQLKVQTTRLLTVDYIHNVDVRGEYLHFLFECKALSESQVLGMKTKKDEIKDYKFTDRDNALLVLNINAARRLASSFESLRNGTEMNYLEDGLVPYFKDDIAL